MYSVLGLGIHERGGGGAVGPLNGWHTSNRMYSIMSSSFACKIILINMYCSTCKTEITQSG